MLFFLSLITLSFLSLPAIWSSFSSIIDIASDYAWSSSSSDSEELLLLSPTVITSSSL